MSPDHHSGGALRTAVEVKDAVSLVGGGFMISSEAKNDGKAVGFRGWQYYMLGRCGVMGEVDAAVLTAVLGFFPEEVVRENWQRARETLSAAAGVTAYVETCRTWGRNRLEGVDDLDRLAALLERVALAAPVAGAPLFAGWRALALPEDDAARVAQLANVLREHRGSAHLVAVLASGLTPLEALLVGPHGAANATWFGWPEPFPTVGPAHRERWERAEASTDELVAPAYAVLDEQESRELVSLLTVVREHVGV